MEKLQSLPTYRHLPSRSLWTRILNYLIAVDAGHRERKALGDLPPHLRRDIGVDDAQVAQELRRPVWDAPRHFTLK